MFRSKTPFERTLDKATSNLLLEPDFDSMLQLCDFIRGGDIKPRDAVAILKGRIKDEKNPNVCFFALSALDTVMKNCGDGVHGEVISQPFLEEMKEMAKSSSADRVKEKALEMIQAWGLAFKNNSTHSIATNLYNVMKAEGFQFPEPTNTADMFKSETAPVWKDGDECSKCHSEFGLVQRKHHCRACGGIFCNKCTSKQSIIPKYGIEKEVRVCDACYHEINPKNGKSTDSNGLPREYLNSALAKESQAPPSRNEQQLKEEEELQIAIAMSLNEQENQSRMSKGTKEVYASVNKNTVAQPPQVKTATDTTELDPELARYLNRNYWEKKKDTQEQQKSQEPKAESKKKVEAVEENHVEPEAAVTQSANEVKEPQKVEENLQNGGMDLQDNEEFLHNLRTSLEIFMNRMRSNKMRNRSIANDSAVQGLFQSINGMHPTLLQFMNELEEKRLHFEALQDKLAQIRDARAALDALREEHKEKMRIAAEEAERIRQIQMAQKLEIMRQKKQEYLAYQRQIALQRLQEQEAARQARLEQQKQFIMHRAMQPAMIVQGYNSQYLPPQANMGEVPPEMHQPASMPSTGYNQYGQSYPPQSVPQQQHHSMVNQGQHYPPQQMTHPGHYQPEYVAQPAGYQGMPTDPHQGPVVQQSQENFDMSGMTRALPQQQHIPGGAPQVVATAPPPTPQSVSMPTQMHVSAPQGHGVMTDDSSMRQQYHQQHVQQDVQANAQQGHAPAPQQNQDLLIMFD